MVCNPEKSGIRRTVNMARGLVNMGLSETRMRAMVAPCDFTPSLSVGPGQANR